MDAKFYENLIFFNFVVTRRFSFVRRWVAGAWSECSRECGGGLRRRKAACMQQVSIDSAVRVKTNLCRHLKRPHRRERCHTEPCPTSWRVGPWSSVRTPPPLNKIHPSSLPPLFALNLSFPTFYKTTKVVLTLTQPFSTLDTS